MVAGLMLLVDLRAVDLGLNSKSHTQNPPTPYTPHPPPQALNPGGPAWGGFRCWPGWTPIYISHTHTHTHTHTHKYI